MQRYPNLIIGPSYSWCCPLYSLDHGSRSSSSDGGKPSLSNAVCMAFFPHAKRRATLPAPSLNSKESSKFSSQSTCTTNRPTNFVDCPSSLGQSSKQKAIDSLTSTRFT